MNLVPQRMAHMYAGLHAKRANPPDGSAPLPDLTAQYPPVEAGRVCVECGDPAEAVARADTAARVCADAIRRRDPEAASAALSKTLDEADIKMPTIKVYSNVTGKPYTSVDEIKTLLKRQLTEAVKWEQGTKDLIAGGHSQYVEPGPGKQLKAMMRRIDPDAWGKTITLDA